MNASDLLLKILHAHGVSQIFGMPGDAINDVLDAIRRQDAIDFIHVKHEESGAFAASAQAKLSGDLAACMGTSGPGAIHLLNGLYDAKMDHAPVIAITGQIATDYLGTEYHQEVDTKRLFSDVACYSETITTAEQLPAVFQEACRAAIANRGVAHVSLPTNISGQSVSADMDRLVTFSRPGRIQPDPSDCAKAADMIVDAERPAILAGIGCAGSASEVLAFAEHIQAPIVRTLRAKDWIDDDHPLCVGGVGLLGGAPGVGTLDDCDLLIMAGTDFPYHDFYPGRAKFIQIDNVGTHIGRRHPVDIGLIGDAGATLAAIQQQIEPVPQRDFFDEKRSEMDRWLERRDKKAASDGTPIKPARLIAELSERAPNNAIFLCDTGTSTAWTARHLTVGANQRYALSGGLASMAFALPGAIGAQLAYPDCRAVAIAGDGGFGMLMQEFVTAVRYKLPIVTIILRNGKLGFIALEQEASGLPDYGTGIANPDFVRFAEACGGVGFSVRETGEIGDALDRAFQGDKPAIIDVEVDPDALIMPPKITLGQAANFSLAKMKELLEAV